MTKSSEENKRNSRKKQDPFIVGFLAGGFGSAISETFTIPFDTAKVRMMLHGMTGKYATVTKALKTIRVEQGTSQLWKGLTSACMQQFVFSGSKLALYEPMRNALCSSEEEIKNTPLLKKIAAGGVGGGIA